ncbi:hypothetical protein [Paenibacillus methanolicus]|uniref:Uncharacterized protein n=1 Tax=Paenibacillus methanolicus TaxID=582686 RepID=A0A5S5CGM0_9BACL|nr:hypothetical protein [Paenibacillus methanolicus]TYP78259.1 hypothetical protein BCM02_102836 [Paenibacillus methanolicus]
MPKNREATSHLDFKLRLVALLALALLALALSTLVSFGSTAHALSCVEREGGPQETLKLYGGAVFGEVKQVKNDQEGFVGTIETVRNVLLDVKQSWNLALDSQVIVATDFTWGFDFKKGQSYLIYVYDDHGRLASDPCSPTYMLNDLAEATQLLGNGLPPGDQVNLAYKMWFMTDTDLDLLIVVGAAVLVVALAVVGVRRFRGKRRR